MCMLSIFQWLSCNRYVHSQCLWPNQRRSPWQVHNSLRGGTTRGKQCPCCHTWGRWIWLGNESVERYRYAGCATLQCGIPWTGRQLKIRSTFAGHGLRRHQNEIRSTVSTVSQGKSSWKRIPTEAARREKQHRLNMWDRCKIDQGKFDKAKERWAISCRTGVFFFSLIPQQRKWQSRDRPCLTLRIILLPHPPHHHQLFHHRPPNICFLLPKCLAQLHFLTLHSHTSHSISLWLYSLLYTFFSSLCSSQ